MSSSVDVAVVFGVVAAGLLRRHATSANNSLAPTTYQISNGGLS